jgi:excisionase family DNA binding protein
MTILLGDNTGRYYGTPRGMKPPGDTPKIDLDWLRTATEAALTRRQTAKLLGVDERTVTRAIQDGEIPSIRMGRRVLIPRLPLLRLLGADTTEAAR